MLTKEVMAYFYIAFSVIRYSALEVIIPIVTASCHTKISRNLVDDICSPIIGCGVIIPLTKSTLILALLLRNRFNILGALRKRTDLKKCLFRFYVASDIRLTRYETV